MTGQPKNQETAVNCPNGMNEQMNKVIMIITTGTFLKSLELFRQSINSPHVMIPEISLPYSQESDIRSLF
jgi:hypothetical protein